MACIEIPLSLHSRLASVTNSLILSMIFLNKEPRQVSQFKIKSKMRQVDRTKVVERDADRKDNENKTRVRRGCRRRIQRRER